MAAFAPVGGQAGDKPDLRPAVVDPLPVASDIRIAGDEKRARFIVEIDRRIEVRAFLLARPNRVVLDIPQTTFRLPTEAGQATRGLIKAYRYGLVMPGGSRIVMDLKRPAKIEKAYVLNGENGQPPKLIVELAATDRASFMHAVATDAREAVALAAAETTAATQTTESANETSKAAAAPAAGSNAPDPAKPADDDPRPVVVIDPGHGGIDHGTQAKSGESEKEIVLDFAKALRDRIVKSGKYRVVMTRDDDTFIPLAERVRIAQRHKAALFVSVHADALPRGGNSVQGATVYTLSDKASDAEAAKLAEAENKADLIGGIDLAEEPADVADILIDLTRRETKAFSSRFAKALVQEMRGVARLHKNPLKSAGFRVLKAPDIPSVLLEIGYVSNQADLKLLVSESWRSKTVGSVAQAVDLFFGKRVVAAEPQKPAR
jgi:N-acetylmuramoyl-L-alanine amidase